MDEEAVAIPPLRCARNFLPLPKHVGDLVASETLARLSFSAARRKFRRDLREHRMSFCSLGGMLGELLGMDAVLLDLNFEAAEGSLGFE